MGHKKSRNKEYQNEKKIEKKTSVFLYILLGVFIFCGLIAIFLFSHKTGPSLYIFPENPKQGQTVFIRVKSLATNISGSFGDEKLDFYQNGKLPEWVAFYGIDADQKIGNYKISITTSNSEQLEKNVNVALADFSSAPVALAPSPSQTGYTNEKAVTNIVKNDNPSIKKVLTDFTQKPYFTAPFSFPLSDIKVSGFSFGRFIDIGTYKIQHLGVDLQAAEDTNVYAVNDGKVVAILDLYNYGKTVIIDHGLDIFSLYLHLDKFNVAQGDMVKRGQLIGLSGNTGYVAGPHLHFSMRVGNSRVDPIEFIKSTQEMNDNSFLADITGLFFR